MYKYEHGGNARFEKENILDFSANINPIGLPKGVEKAICGAVSECVQYPDYESKHLREKIAAFECIPMEHIICANGASELIFRLVYSIKPKKALVLAPSFLDYTRALNAYECQVYYYMLYEKNDFQIQSDMLEIVKKEKFELVFVCNPNNPTGVLTEKQFLAKLIKECSKAGTYLVIDECFLDFVWEEEKLSAKAMIKEYDNLIILKAFTKIFAMPGIRLGYGICSNYNLIEKLYFVGADWSVSAIAQAAGITALNNPRPYIEKSRKIIEEEKKILIKNLEKLHYKVMGSKAGYLFFKSPYSFDLAKELYEKYSIFIRSCGNYIGLNKNYYRIGIKTKNENIRLSDSIIEITKDKM